jgi:hypothetical protein
MIEIGVNAYDDEPLTMTVDSEGLASDAPPDARARARGSLPCGDHGRRKPWVVCPHIEPVIRAEADPVEYRHVAAERRPSFSKTA